MKIAIDAYHALFPSGGITRYAKNLISSIAEIAPQDELILFYNRFRERGKIWKPEGRNARAVQLLFPRHLAQRIWENFERPPIELFCGDIDIFHGLHFVLPPTARARRVLTVHDLTYLKFPHYFADSKLNERGYRSELTAGLRRADMVIAVSGKTRADLLETMKFREERVRVIYEGVDPQFFAPLEGEAIAAIIESYGLRSPYLVFLAGTPEPRKNIALAVDAVTRTRTGLPLVLIGPREPLKRLLGANRKNVILTGIVPNEHLPALLCGAQVSLYPSLYEGFGLPVLESMACGVPVVASNRGSIPEVAGDAAILIDPEDVDAMAQAILKVLENEDLETRLKAKGRERAARFSWQKTAMETMSLYRELL